MEAALADLESELGSRSEELRAREAEVSILGESARIGELRLAERGAEVDALRAELAGARTMAEQELRSLTLVARQLEELRIGARGQATRIRLRALREAAELSARLADATAPEADVERDRVLDALETAIARVAGEWEAGEPVPPLARRSRRSGVEPGIEIATEPEIIVTANGRPGGAGKRRVSVDVGPFADFSQLVRFEDAANSIGGTGDISIKRFSEGRATIDVAIREPIDLLRELEARCDLDFEVRSRDADAIILDVT